MRYKGEIIMDQIVVWEGTIVGENKREEFEDWMKDNGFHVQYLTEFKTLPDKEDGELVPDTGGRNDLLFTIDANDVKKFAIWRLGYGMRWWEDYLDNGSYKFVPFQVLEQYKYGWGNNPYKYCPQEALPPNGKTWLDVPGAFIRSDISDYKDEDGEING